MGRKWSDLTLWVYKTQTEIKHNILIRYLQAWFAFNAQGHSSCKQLVVVDGFAERGSYHSSEHSPLNTQRKDGSPLYMINTLLTHSAQEQILNNVKITFLFIDEDINNHNALEID